MVAFIDDQKSIRPDSVVDDSFAHQALDQRDIHDSGQFATPTPSRPRARSGKMARGTPSFALNPWPGFRAKDGGAEGSRTPDLLIANERCKCAWLLRIATVLM